MDPGVGGVFAHWSRAGEARRPSNMPPTTEPQPGLGRALRRLREDRGMTQEEVAHQADLHPTWVSHLESGRINPRWGVVRRVADALGASVRDVAELAERLEPGRAKRRVQPGGAPRTKGRWSSSKATGN